MCVFEVLLRYLKIYWSDELVEKYREYDVTFEYLVKGRIALKEF